MGRSMRYGLHLLDNWNYDTEWTFNARDAENFFYEEVIHRDRKYRRVKEVLKLQESALRKARADPATICSCNLWGEFRKYRNANHLEEDVKETERKLARGKINYTMCVKR